MLWKIIVWIMRKKDFLRLIKVGNEIYYIEISKYESACSELERWESIINEGG